MDITFLGAAKTVTGSCYLIETEDKKIMVDCGLFQGHNKQTELNKEPFPFEVDEIDFVLLTHAHIDHTGRIPKLVKDGYKGPIIATKATKELCEIMLPDSGHIQEMEAMWKNKKRERKGKKLVEPLYTVSDAKKSLENFKTYEYYEEINLSKNIKVKFLNAGHILGSSFIEIWITENDETNKIVFTGDIGNYEDIPLLQNPDVIQNADYLVMESTYGDRLHEDDKDKVDKLMIAIRDTIGQGGNVVIPSFAVGRTQEIIYELHKFKEKYGGYINFIQKLPVYIDSPLAISATEVFRNNLDYFDAEAKEYIANGDNPLEFPGLKFSRTAEDSKALNKIEDPIVIVSASGMCTAGRIKHHLKHNIWKNDTTILFVGYQAEGTLGRRIIEGSKEVKIFGEKISVNANIESIEGFSGHADQEGLLRFLRNFKKLPKKVFIVHGSTDAQKTFKSLIDKEFSMNTVIPERGDTYEITAEAARFTKENVELKERFKRLEFLARLEMLQEEVEYLVRHNTVDDINKKTDREVDEMKKKFDKLEKMMSSVKAQVR